MAITTEIIGRFGGGVDIVEVSVVNVSGSSTAHLLTHINVPEGKQYVVSLIGSFSATVGGSRAPEFQIGNVKDVTSGYTGAHASMSAILTAPGDVNILTNSTGNVSFSGTVYTSEI